MSKHSQSKNFKKPPTSWRNAQSQIPQNGSYSTSGPRPPKGSPQFHVPTTPPLNQQPGMQRTQQRYPAGPGVPPSYAPSQFNVPTTPPLNQQPGMQRTQQRYPARPGVPPSYAPSQYRVPTTLPPRIPVRSFVGVPATPRVGIPPVIVDPRIRHRIEQYTQWLQLNNNLSVSPHQIQAYQNAALEINKVDKREVRTFAPFQERTSALNVLTPDQVTILAILLIYWSLGLFFLHLTMLTITLAIITLLYISGFITSGMLATKSLSSSSGEKIDEEIIRAFDRLGVEWPTYTILCPLYKEANIVPQFVEAIKALNYPFDKLQVLFLTEENDNETRAALDRMHLPRSFTILTVPKGTPQTKPRACNFGLMQAKGQFIVIFDAEDKPEPYQLKKAILTFANYGSEVACVQAKLNYYNTEQNLLTRWFTAEYSTWFDIMLPGLQRIGFSLPLGGTSNHFRTEVLRALGGWDAFNVTEDCDLGLRISQYGLKTAVLDSTTYEEATSRIKIWLFQRSRWIKGYLQTYLVHMRHPLQTLQQGHLRKFCSLQIIVGAWTFVLLLNPFMWALTLLYILFHPVHIYSVLFPGPILYLGAFCLIFGNFFYVYIHLLGCLRREEYALIKWVLLIPLYWVMMSASAYIAFYQLIVKPHHWEKTQHGNHLTASARARVHTSLPGVELEGRAVVSSMPTMHIFPVTIGRVFKEVTATLTLETTTQRVTALRDTLSTRLEQRKFRRQMHQPRVRDLWLIATTLIACIASIASTCYYFQQHEILLYGDALSHMRIARSVFDNATPGIAQLGGVWLPLPHILMWPFIWNDYLWGTGLAGSFVSMPCYVLSSAYIFLSARRLTKNSLVSLLGTLVFMLNPNILYVQSTPLSETVCIATFSITCYYFLVWAQNGHTHFLIFAAVSTFLGTLARYDGWALFLAILVMIPIIDLMRRKSLTQIIANEIIFGILGGFGILLWLSWDKIIFGDPLFFQHGPYSAQAQQNGWRYAHLLFTYHDFWMVIYTFSLDMIEITGLVFCVLASVAFVAFVLYHWLKPQTIAIGVFFVPLVFYITSLYSGQAALFLPGLGPGIIHNLFFNARYGTQMVPSIAVFIAILAGYLKFKKHPRWSRFWQIVLLAVIVAQTVATVTGGIITVQDGQSGLSCDPEHPINIYLAQHYDRGKILENIYENNIDGEEAGIHFSNFIYEGSGQLWTNALKNPAGTVDWIIVHADDPLDPVFTHINIYSPAFNAQYTLVVQEAGSQPLRLYHRNGLPPLPTRSIPSSLLTEHLICSNSKK